MNSALSQLLHLTDLTLPIGGFSHSAGLETYVQAGIVNDRETAKEFIYSMLTHNIKYTDATLLSLAFDAAEKNDSKKIIELDELCNAIKLPAEIRQASIKMGNRLDKIFSRFCNTTSAEGYHRSLLSKEIKGHYCITFAVYANSLTIPKADAIKAFYFNACAGLVNNCVKLIPLGQDHGQEILFSFHDLINELCIETISPDEKFIGLSCNGFDIRAMQHENLYSRLYMS